MVIDCKILPDTVNIFIPKIANINNTTKMNKYIKYISSYYNINYDNIEFLNTPGYCSIEYKDINYSIVEDRYISVGSGATSIYSVPVYNFASAISDATSGIVTSITITNPGFGYNQANPPKVLIESEKTLPNWSEPEME